MSARRPSAVRPRREAEREAAAKSAATRIFRILRRRVDDPSLGFSWAEAARITFVQLCRPEHVGGRLSATRREALRAYLDERSQTGDDPTDARALQAFCEDAAFAAYAAVPRGRHPGSVLVQSRSGVEDGTRSSLRELAEAAVWAEIAHARGDEDAVARAVTRAMRERRRQNRGTVRLDVQKEDPLHGLLSLPDRREVRVARGDVRAAMVKGDGVSALLRKASAFSDDRLRDALGEELWGLCRPTGFSDRARTRLVVRVVSNVVAHEVQMRKTELIARIKKVRGFEKVRDVRFDIRAR